ncbi:MAG TPA: hypothetical protein VLE21_03480 [Candidatus Nitrosocosmicus sp.]|nr:hypothetical protein [Candidatus Nitrosocosmicus sp.]
MKRALPHLKSTSVQDSFYTYQNLIMVIGLILSFSGGSWDITFHILSQPESFFSYPHSLVYSGILLVISIFFINFKRNFEAEKTIKKNNIIILAGIVLILAAGPFDFSWHLEFGLDGLLSPPHLTLLTGWLLIAIGNLRITNVRVDRSKNKITESTSPDYDFNIIELKNIKSNSDRDKGSADITSPNKFKENSIRNENNNSYEKSPILYRIQVFLNLSILLMILSGFLYFFSLPFSETQSYNFNPPPLLAFFVYGLGFPILFSAYFIYILKRYPDLKILVPLVGAFYVIITLITQISSNSFLSEYFGYYLLNLIPFALFYLVNRYQLAKKEISKEEKAGFLSSVKQRDGFSRVTSNYPSIFLAIIFGVLSYSLCFPLNTYVYNEVMYGYLIYQNLVVKVYQEVIFENFMIIASMSVAGGFIGHMLNYKRQFISNRTND